MVQLVKNLPAVWETWVQSLVWEDPLEKGTATHSGILAWGRKEWDMTEQLSLLIYFTVYDRLYVHPHFDKGPYSIPFMSEQGIIPLHVYTTSSLYSHLLTT